MASSLRRITGTNSRPEVKRARSDGRARLQNRARAFLVSTLPTRLVSTTNRVSTRRTVHGRGRSRPRHSAGRLHLRGRHLGSGRAPDRAQTQQRPSDLYKSDPDLQAAHAAFPWLVSWDDHEVNNNYASSTPQDPDKQTAAEFFVRRLAATQAYYEHMPLRNFPVPKGGDLDLRLYGRTTFGDLAQVHLLDTRQYRSDQVCPRGDYVSPDCADRHAPSRTMLGEQQEAWLLNGLERSEATWNVVAQQVWFGQYRFMTGAEPEFNRDAWDGYPVQRQRIVDLAAAKRASNPVVLSGDWHNSCVRNIHRNADDPTSEVVMTEFAGTSLSSRTGRTSQIQASLADNPHVKFFDGRSSRLRALPHRALVRRQEPEETRISGCGGSLRLRRVSENRWVAVSGIYRGQGVSPAHQDGSPHARTGVQPPEAPTAPRPVARAEALSGAADGEDTRRLLHARVP